MTPDQVIARYQATYLNVRTAAAARVAGLWDRLGGLTDEQADAFIAAALPVVAGAQTATGGLVAAYISTLTGLVTGEPARPAAIRPADLSTGALRGVAAAEVYRRPAVAARTAIANGRSPQEAFRFGRNRASDLAETDVILAQREATVRSVSLDERIVGYRRVLTGRSCAFCATASTQRYRTADLMPIHDRCDCGVAPIYGDRDPGQVINKGLLRDIKTASKGRSGDYWNARHFNVSEDGDLEFPKVAVHEHGELGPVLTAAGDHFTGPAGIAA